ncbi:hypothetical protein [Mesobacillus jeotgali]|uniref:Helix-turn-helix domain-containing protein n=1 Tax=Mesobacillus jeotgali TaxID=129985 RepID=A0ABY9VLX4_9BACI|nr:hypothetical protein [Mesobacillus jeotgali]WNF24949.1 hypothetical protein RH061_10880 [Mesobacillus jeotgali]
MFFSNSTAAHTTNTAPIDNEELAYHHLTSGTTTCPSLVYYFSDDVIAAICKNHPEAAGIYTDSLIYKFRTLAEIIAHLDSPVEQQMAFYLLKLVQENGNASMNQTAFSKYIGTSRITVNKIIQ